MYEYYYFNHTKLDSSMLCFSVCSVHAIMQCSQLLSKIIQTNMMWNEHCMQSLLGSITKRLQQHCIPDCCPFPSQGMRSWQDDVS